MADPLSPLGFVLQPVPALGKGRGADKGLFWEKAGSLDQCGSCVRVTTVVSILGVTSQNLSLNDSEPQEISGVGGRGGRGQGVIKSLVGIMCRS